jgi:hypothetical protein
VYTAGGLGDDEKEGRNVDGSSEEEEEEVVNGEKRGG